MRNITQLSQDTHETYRATELTGVWSGSDSGTYYVRQVGNIVWWLGLSRDRGATFANVFRGTLQQNTISGEWADVPLGGILGSEMLTLEGPAGPVSVRLSKHSFSGGFGAQEWEKLYDIPSDIRPLAADPRPIR